jgi:anti-sigma B factor antagonist
MEFHTKQVNEVSILTIIGSIDAFTAPRIAELIDSQIASGNIKLVADLKGVDYTSSAGLRALLGGIKATRSRGGDLRLVAVQPDVLKVLNMSGFSSILQLFDTINSALNSFNASDEISDDR